MDFYVTNPGERPDLAAIEVNQPEEYIGMKILPQANIADQSGTIYYATITADVAAQTNRSVGAAPNRTQISDSSTTFIVAERIKGAAITPVEAKQMGGAANFLKVEQIGARFAKRSVMKSQESEIATAVLGGTVSAQFDPAKLLTMAQTALQTLRLYSGKTTLVSSAMVFKAMVQACLADSTFGPSFARVITGNTPGVAVSGMNFEAWKQGLAFCLGIDQILLGDDDIWNAAPIVTAQGRFAIGKYDVSPDELAHKYLPVYGRTFVYTPDGAANPWYVEAIPDRITKNNYFDATIRDDIVVLNSGASYLFDGVQ